MMVTVMTINRVCSVIMSKAEVWQGPGSRESQSRCNICVFCYLKFSFVGSCEQSVASPS